jgi:hypothetical protein
MAEGNGTDMGSLAAMLGQVLRTVEKLSVDMGLLKTDVAELKCDMSENKRDIAALRDEVRAYNGSVSGHGFLITELQDRVHRIEDNLHLPPIESH